MAQQVKVPTSLHEDVGSMASLMGLRIWHCPKLWLRSEIWLQSGVAMAVA